MTTATESLCIQPHNLEAEQSVLGAILLDNTALAKAMEVVSEEDFYRIAHRKVYRAMRDLSEQGESIDHITLSEYLRAKGDLEPIGGAAYLGELVQGVPSAANIRSHLKIVRENALRRRIIAAAEMTRQGAYSGADVGVILKDLRAATDSFDGHIDTVPSNQKTMTWQEFLMQPQERNEWLIESLLRPGWLVGLVGHGKRGKTTLALHLLASLAAGETWAGCAVSRACPAIYAGYEMHEADLATLLRSLCQKNFEHVPRLLNLQAPLDIGLLNRTLATEPTRGAIVIDSFRAAFLLGKDCEKDAGVAGLILRKLSAVAHSTGWTIIVIHHFRKSATGDFLDASGSSEWVAAPDAVWTWDRPKADEPGTLRVTGRMPPRDDLAIRLTPDACEHIGTPRDAHEKAALRPTLSRLPDGGKWVTVDDLRKDWPDAPASSTLRDRLRKLVKQGLVERSGAGGKSDPLRFRKIRSTDLNVYRPSNQSEEEVVNLAD